MKKILSITFILVFFWGSIQKNLLSVFGADNQSPGTLYSESAVLMDADSGRILYEKNGYEQRPMASTTKIMTCILALENGKEEDIVTASEYAASRPKVHLGVRKGEQFRFGDLLYSLMLESHNDTAVMLAEHLEGDVETFADKMNQKAKKIGCRHTFFITPNGLDATKKTGEKEQVHSTTAADLARIMRYCIEESPQKEAFLNITRTQSYTFWDIEKKRSFSCNNHNAFLSMMEGALSGKTGFTAKAGYCYVGALKREEKTLIVALLACGWPNNKTYKWKDTVKLMEYGLNQYEQKSLLEQGTFSLPETLVVENGQAEKIGGTASIPLKVESIQDKTLLMRKGESVRVIYEGKTKLSAPIKKGKCVGTLKYIVGDCVYLSRPVYTAKSVKAIDYKWCLEKIAKQWTFTFSDNMVE